MSDDIEMRRRAALWATSNLKEIPFTGEALYQAMAAFARAEVERALTEHVEEERELEHCDKCHRPSDWELFMQKHPDLLAKAVAESDCENAVYEAVERERREIVEIVGGHASCRGAEVCCAGILRSIEQRGGKQQ